MQEVFNGSPPRVRGIHIAFFMPIMATRFTPACAGNTLCLHSPYVVATVHPRVCGEYAVPLALMLFISGSPPRVRGIRSLALDRGLAESVHPRVCGEYYCCKIAHPFYLGSPPRVRGIL